MHKRRLIVRYNRGFAYKCAKVMGRVGCRQTKKGRTTIDQAFKPGSAGLINEAGASTGSVGRSRVLDGPDGPC